MNKRCLPDGSSAGNNGSVACGSRAMSASKLWQAATSARCKSEARQIRSNSSSLSAGIVLSRYSATELASSASPRLSNRGAESVASSPIRRIRSRSCPAARLAWTLSVSSFCWSAGRTLSSQAKSVRRVSRIEEFSAFSPQLPIATAFEKPKWVFYPVQRSKPRGAA